MIRCGTVCGVDSMAKPFAIKFYNSKAWRVCRKSYYQSVDGLCEKCIEEGKVKLGDEVHHKIELTPDNIDDPNITLAWSNLQLLCFTCHQDITHERKKPMRKGLCFNEYGELVQEKE
jgi:5-methylcytosine-specific restriction endonuclease McrA